MAAPGSPLSIFSAGDGPDGRRGPREGTHHYHLKQRQLQTWKDMGGGEGRDVGKPPSNAGRKTPSRDVLVQTERLGPFALAQPLGSPGAMPGENRPMTTPARLPPPPPRPESQMSHATAPTRSVPTISGSPHRGRPAPSTGAGGPPPRAATPAGRLLTPDAAGTGDELSSLPPPSDAPAIRARGRKGGLVVPQPRGDKRHPLRNTFTVPEQRASSPDSTADQDLCNTWFRHNRRRPRPLSQEYHTKVSGTHVGLTRSGMRDYTGLCSRLGQSPSPVRTRSRREQERNEEVGEVSALDDWKELAQSEITLLTQGILTKYKMGKWIPDAETVWDYHLERNVQMENERVVKEAQRLDQLDKDYEAAKQQRRSSLYDRLQCQPRPDPPSGLSA